MEMGFLVCVRSRESKIHLPQAPEPAIVFLLMVKSQPGEWHGLGGWKGGGGKDLTSEKYNTGGCELNTFEP